MKSPKRGFPDQEFHDRTKRAQALMKDAGLAAILVTTEAEVRYYTGFLTRFWESPTRPWFVVVPQTGRPIAVIPSIGTHLMQGTWVEDIRSWSSPDYDDDGIGLLADTLSEVTPRDARIGIADQLESHVRMPLGSVVDLKSRLGLRQLVGDANVTRELRLIKSDAEVEKIRFSAGLADRAFDRVPQIAKAGVPLSHVFREFQMLCLDEGADWVPYLAGAAEQGGYADVISPASDDPLANGDILMLDTGLVWDGYFCDFDRNFSVGQPNHTSQEAHTRLIKATRAAFEVAKPGAKISDLFHAMDDIVNPNGTAMEAGRLGHGLGMQLTEWPSIIPQDQTTLEVGMVLTLEPSVKTRDNKIMVHEENIVIRQHGAEYISTPQVSDMRVV